MKISDIPTSPDLKTLRQFSVLWILFFGGIGGYQLYQGNHVFAFVSLAIAGVVGVPGFAWPKLLKPIFVTWMILAFPIGWIVSHVVLFLIFFGLFMPLGQILKLFGHDPLKLMKPNTDSFWIVKSQEKDLKRYLRQF